MHLSSTILQPLYALRELRNIHGIHIRLDAHSNIGSFKGVRLSIGENTWTILINDEYNDLRESSQLMCLYLCLRSLENYQYEPDFLKWCMHNNADASDFDLLQYYRSLGKTTYDIEQVIGPIDSRISNLDYELRTGIIRELVQAG